MVMQKCRSKINKETSKTEVLQTPSAIEVNLGHGVSSKHFRILEFLKIFESLI